MQNSKKTPNHVLFSVFNRVKQIAKRIANICFDSTENYRVGNFLFLCCQYLKNCTQKSRTQIHRCKSNDSFFAHGFNDCLDIRFQVVWNLCFLQEIIATSSTSFSAITSPSANVIAISLDTAVSGTSTVSAAVALL